MARKTTKKRRVFSYFITTIPVIRRCSCGCWLAAGIVDGLHVKADLVQLDASQSLLAIVSGLQLYSMTRTGLVHLDRYRLEDSKFAGRLPEHRCGVVWPSRVPGAGPIEVGSSSDIPPY